MRRSRLGLGVVITTRVLGTGLALLGGTGSVLLLPFGWLAGFTTWTAFWLAFGYLVVLAALAGTAAVAAGRRTVPASGALAAALLWVAGAGALALYRIWPDSADPYAWEHKAVNDIVPVLVALVVLALALPALALAAAGRRSAASESHEGNGPSRV